MITQSINLNLIPGGVLPRINVSQYDKGGRTLEFNLYNGSTAFIIPGNSTITIQGTKADKTGFQYECTYSGSVVTADLEQQMTVFAGDVICELVITNSGNILGSANFVLNVEEAALAGDTIISETDLPLIEEAAELAERIDGIVQQVNEDAQTASNAATAATNAKDVAEESADKAEAYGTHPPYIGTNGNWYVYNVTTQQYEDSGVKAQGPLSGLTDVEITNAQDGQEITYDGTRRKWKNTSKIQTLTNNVGVLAENGAINRLPNNVTTQTINGVTFTINANDKTITANGTSTDVCILPVDSSTRTLALDGNYRLSGCPSGGSSTTYMLRISPATGAFVYDYGNGATTILSSDNLIKVEIRISSGVTLNNLVFKPMIADADYSGDYVPYAMTNKELTENVLGIVSNGNLKQISGTTPFADLKNMNIYQINSSESVSPFPGYGVAVLVIKNSSITGVQLAFCITSSSDVSNGFMAYRVCYQGTYSNWTKISGTNVT